MLIKAIAVGTLFAQDAIRVYGAVIIDVSSFAGDDLVEFPQAFSIGTDEYKSFLSVSILTKLWHQSIQLKIQNKLLYLINLL